MLITDEKLSAFLDAELPENEMQLIRDRLTEDDALVERLAEFSALNEALRVRAAAIDEEPLPEAIQTLMQQTPPFRVSAADEASGKVLSFTRRITTNRPVWGYLAAAASIAFVMGIGVQSWFFSTPSSSHSIAQNMSPGLAHVLDTTQSFNAHKLGDSVVTVIQTFKAGEKWCRQYRIDKKEASIHVACRSLATPHQWQWQQGVKAQAQGYQLASGEEAAKRMIEHYEEVILLDAQEEQAALRAHWP